MNNTAITFTAAMLLALLVTAVIALPDSAGAQSSSPEVKRSGSPFACNRLALTSEQRKRHLFTTVSYQKYRREAVRIDLIGGRKDSSYAKHCILLIPLAAGNGFKKIPLPAPTPPI